MKTSDYILDAEATLGKAPYIAIGCEEVFEFDKDTNQRTDKLIAYKVDIVLPHKKFAKVSIKIATTKNPLPDFNANEYSEVNFINLTLGLYTDKVGKIQLYGKADSVQLANTDKTNLKLNSKTE